MEYRVKIVTDAKRASVRNLHDGRLLVSVTAPRKDGRANECLREILAEYFHVSIEQVSIIRGRAQATKTIRII